jgi:DNA repair protein RadD
MVVTEEFIDRFMSDDFIDASDDALIDNAIAVMREQGIDIEALGLTREDVTRRFAARRQERESPEPERLTVQPQERRKALRQRLQEQAQSAANRVIEALGERPGGRRIAALGGTGAANNLGAVIALMHSAVNEYIGIESNARRDQDTEALERGILALDDIADQVEADLRQRLDGASS